MTIHDQQRRRRWSYVYSLLIGILGVLILVQLFERQRAPFDLPTLLLFALTSLIVSYFKVPTGTRNTEVGLEGAMLLGAALVGGPVLGGWTAFITGLAWPLKSFDEILPEPYSEISAFTDRRPFRIRWVATASSAALNGGRNVMALSTAWLAYQGLGGTLSPTAVDTSLALALVVLCLVYGLLRCLLQWPAVVLQSAAPEQALASIAHPYAMLIETIPLPVSLLISAVFVQLGWSFFLLLALVFIGLSAVMRQMMISIVTTRKQVEVLVLAEQIRQAISSTPPTVGALSRLAYRLCSEITSTPKFEIGLYTTEHPLSTEKESASIPEPEDEAHEQETQSHVHIPLSVVHGEALPPMRVPITACWGWLSQQRRPKLIQNQEQIALLPFDLPPIQRGEAPQAAILAPLQVVSIDKDSIAQARAYEQASPGGEDRDDREVERAAPRDPIGALILQSPYPHAFSPSDVDRIALIAGQIAAAIDALTADSHAMPVNTTDKPDDREAVPVPAEP
ncbi:MAG: hypothetical protein ISS56_14615 [Anaerolineae bacterium]|nr:hypothetical protein [Anaerolineae bacterium]